MNGVSMDGRLTDDMCRVPAGTFRQGSTRSPDEQPVREVQLSAYAIDRMPVTNRAYGEFIKDGGYKDPSLWTPAGGSSSAHMTSPSPTTGTTRSGGTPTCRLLA